MRYLVGLIGGGIGASGSPAIHEREARQLGVELHYHLVDLETHGRAPGDLAELLASAERLGFAGVNITHPVKQAVIPLLDELSPEAEAIGAVNTVVFRAGRRVGHNTDWCGFSESLRRGLPGARLDAVLLVGAGGGGSAVCYAALRLGVQRLVVFDQDAARAERLVPPFRPPISEARASPPSPITSPPSTASTALIHATPTGMAGHPGMAIESRAPAPRPVGGRPRLFPAANGAPPRGPPVRLRNARRRRHGRVPRRPRPFACSPESTRTANACWPSSGPLSTPERGATGLRGPCPEPPTRPRASPSGEP